MTQTARKAECWSCGNVPVEKVDGVDYCKRCATFAKQRGTRESRRTVLKERPVAACLCAKKHNAPGPHHELGCPRHTPF